MAANGPRDEIAWDLDWDDLTGGAAPPASPTTTGTTTPSGTAGQPPSASTPPAAPQRAFPVPAGSFPDAEPAAIMPVQHVTMSAPPAAPTHVAPPVPVPFLPPDVTAAAPKPGVPVRSLVRGQRIKLAEILPGAPPPAFEVILGLAPVAGQPMDLSCFGLDENGQLSDDRYFLFFNQKSSPEGALSIRGAQGEVFGVDLGRLPGTVRRLVFTANVDGAGSVRALGPSRFELRAAGGGVVTRYEFSGGELEEVKALMVAEIYFKDGWRLAAVGQGFAGGLSELLRHFGGQEA